MEPGSLSASSTCETFFQETHNLAHIFELVFDVILLQIVFSPEESLDL
jgi:hypothetical protein